METAINKPMLPPKAGYVEVEVDGVRRYRNVKTGEIFGQETIPTTDARIASLETENAALREANVALEDAMCEMDLASQEQIATLQADNTALEDALCEMDLANEERFVAIEDALCELDAN